ncbi:CDP-diacylglycerol-glycerol-3-phosphate 3-phosphatidyltransferase [Acididesulfobacillus acetoxydans]|uniref:CDP-diacylglycerol--glycerol-3-phosphate 3-phosphatidyltransferase n=1 Tax=Acididesulfobacillus acetoxydans TaxID=1561005 RepID=A0A8S0W9D0_9FIRM|nr:CDP-diacylglycerol--glycerol-3-phosphate 3-phosphatidyltransferase [Acididesulfobacillus acetoxydans]CAA7602499.1 CDP-diacylglycerol-glycerol-3-phosphate 3-phosphatidyltransferase [Acididesulfobacillus acetoxydans]CEJ05954.1 CDP-diacylglycerol--glycerol-3-phosphate 3-phosphatidyltransferase [Acididesulfobacillus acetoxydans]
MNLPNRLTLARIIIIPVFMAFLLLQVPQGHTLFAHQDVVAAVIFILASATDGLDGYIARKRHQVTVLGKFMDPLADKLLVSAALISLVQLGEVPAWIAWTILGREFAVTGLRAIAAADGHVISASKLGKIKTVTQVIAISAILLHDWPFSLLNIPIGQPFLYLALVFTIISGIDYLLKARLLLRK